MGAINGRTPTSGFIVPRYCRGETRRIAAQPDKKSACETGGRGCIVETFRGSGDAHSMRGLLLADCRFLICRNSKKSVAER